MNERYREHAGGGFWPVSEILGLLAISPGQTSEDRSHKAGRASNLMRQCMSLIAQRTKFTFNYDGSLMSRFAELKPEYRFSLFAKHR
jgi:hypothetical protein